MSELLRLREWLGINDAIRYAKYLGLHAEKSDFFSAYTESDYPLRLTNENGRLFLFIPKEEGNYPRKIWMTWNEEQSRWDNQDGSVVAAGNWIDIAPKMYQRRYSHFETVGIVDDIAFEGDTEVAPVYWETHKDQLQDSDFSAITWGDISGDHSGNALELSRKHIEALVRRAMGQPEPEKKPDLPAPLFASADHESYPPELHTAALLWEALYIKGEKKPHHSHKQAATLWLRKNQETMPTAGLSNNGSDAMTERLITITTPAAKKPKR